MPDASTPAGPKPRAAWHGAIRAMAAVLAPPCCVLCGGTGQWLEEPWGLDLCSHCEQACPRWQPEPLPFDATFCLFRYRPPADQLVTRLKFQGELACARVLGTLFARAWQADGNPPPECLVPLPLHRQRHRERGFCQTTCIARHLAPRLRDAHGRRIAVRTDLLRRVRATQAQSGLSAAERAANLRGAFVVAGGVRVPRHVALLDDVLTTGSTAMAAAAALKDAGAATVALWCCARA
jgi:ComF family protein